jgi:hypothetical protein
VYIVVVGVGEISMALTCGMYITVSSVTAMMAMEMAINGNSL